LRRLQERFPGELTVISVHSGKFPGEKQTERVREAVLRHDIRNPVVNDPDFAVWRAYTVRAWPTLVLITPAGYIAHTQSGEIRADDWEPLIADLAQDWNARGQLDRRPLDQRPDALAEPVRPLRFPGKVLADPANGRLFVADTGHHRIVEVRRNYDNQVKGGEVTRVYGTGEAAFRDGPASEAAFHSPHGMALASEHTLYVADTENHAVRAIDLKSGLVRTVAGTGEKGEGRIAAGTNTLPTERSLRSPWALLAAGPDLLFVAMAGSHQIWALVNEQQIGVFAGNGREALVDGPRNQASFNQPSDLAFGLNHLFVADPGGKRRARHHAFRRAGGHNPDRPGLV
jgi:hypothetical protein